MPASVIKNFFGVVSTGAKRPVGTEAVLGAVARRPFRLGSVEPEVNVFGVLSRTYTISSMVKGQRYPEARAYLPSRALCGDGPGRTTAPKSESDPKTIANPI